MMQFAAETPWRQSCYRICEADLWRLMYLWQKPCQNF